MTTETTIAAATAKPAAPSTPLTWKARLIGIMVGVLMVGGGAGLFVLNHKIANSSGHLTSFGVTGILVGLLIVVGSVSK